MVAELALITFSGVITGACVYTLVDIIMDSVMLRGPKAHQAQPSDTSTKDKN